MHRLCYTNALSRHHCISEPFETYILACKVQDRAIAQLAVDNTLNKNLRNKANRQFIEHLEELNPENISILVRLRIRDKRCNADNYQCPADQISCGFRRL